MKFSKFASIIAIIFAVYAVLCYPIQVLDCETKNMTFICSLVHVEQRTA